MDSYFLIIYLCSWHSASLRMETLWTRRLFMSPPLIFPGASTKTVSSEKLAINRGKRRSRRETERQIYGIKESVNPKKQLRWEHGGNELLIFSRKSAFFERNFNPSCCAPRSHNVVVIKQRPVDQAGLTMISSILTTHRRHRPPPLHLPRLLSHSR